MKAKEGWGKEIRQEIPIALPRDKKEGESIIATVRILVEGMGPEGAAKEEGRLSGIVAATLSSVD